MQKVKRKVDFTQGRVFLKIVWFILPIMVTNLLQMFYNAADMMVVSMSHEPNAKGAIGMTGAFIQLVINVFIGFSVGANVVVSREIGAKNKENTQKAVHTSLMMAVLFGVIGGAIGLLVARPVLHFMGAEGSLLNLAVTYTSIYFACVPFLALANYLIAADCVIDNRNFERWTEFLLRFGGGLVGRRRCACNSNCERCFGDNFINKTAQRPRLYNLFMGEIKAGQASFSRYCKKRSASGYPRGIVLPF